MKKAEVIAILEKEFADYVRGLGRGIGGLHNMLFTFFKAGTEKNNA